MGCRLPIDDFLWCGLASHDNDDLEVLLRLVVVNSLRVMSALAAAAAASSQVHAPEDLAHYALQTTDIEFDYPFGWGEVS